MECFEWVNRGGAARRNIAGNEGGVNQAERDSGGGDGVNGVDVEENTGHQAHDDDGRGEAERSAYPGKDEAMADEHGGERLRLCAKCHADADFTDALGDGAGNYAVFWGRRLLINAVVSMGRRNTKLKV